MKGSKYIFNIFNDIYIICSEVGQNENASKGVMLYSFGAICRYFCCANIAMVVSRGQLPAYSPFTFMNRCGVAIVDAHLPLSCLNWVTHLKPVFPIA